MTSEKSTKEFAPRQQLGKQPLDALLQEHGLSNTDLVQNSGNQLTHKIVQKARNGHELAKKSQHKVLLAVQQSLPDEVLTLKDLFSY